MEPAAADRDRTRLLAEEVSGLVYAVVIATALAAGHAAGPRCWLAAGPTRAHSRLTQLPTRSGASWPP